MYDNTNDTMNTMNTINENIAWTEYPQNTVPAVPAVQETAKPRKKRFAGILAVALGCSLLGGLIGAGGVAAYSKWSAKDTATVAEADEDGVSEILVGTRNNAKVETTAVSKDKELSAADIYEANVNATVGITTTSTTNYFGYKTTAAASGSGFVLTSDGYIVTNYHVVEGADKIKVTTYDDTSYDATLVGCDESNDIAVLKVDAKGMQTVVVGDSDALRVGDSVVAIGNPLGELTFSLTHGDISALNRKVTINNNAMTLIQTDCAINSGNSGGALFNAYGEVIGITNAKYSSSGFSGTASIDNVGFAIPMNSVIGIIKSIIEKGYIEKTYIGIGVTNLESQNQSTGLSGALVVSVEEGGPADKAGLKENDVITKVNGTLITGTDDLIRMIAAGSEGDVVTLTVYRDGETSVIKVTLAVRRQSTLPEKQNETGDNPEKQEQQGNKGQDRKNGRSGQSGETPFGGEYPSFDDLFPFGDEDSFNGNGPF
ncbi:MAG: trypsin-like peptidase domain-containing protein [Lachnospiraceae bacterium]|nr:trypsin-like peptidase domain-containing protein [Lachnospiraceae bacterium]